MRLPDSRPVERRQRTREAEEPAAEIRRARAKRLGGDPKRARRDIDEYLERNPEDAAALFEKSRILYELGERPASLDAKLRALAIKNAATDAVAIADMLIEDSLHTEAEMLLRGRLDRDDEQFTTRFTLAKLLLITGRFIEAEEEIRMLQKRSAKAPLVRADYLEALRFALLGDAEGLGALRDRLRANAVPAYRLEFFDALHEFIAGGNPDTFAAAMARIRQAVRGKEIYRNFFSLIHPDLFLGAENRARQEFHRVLGERLRAPKISGAEFSNEERAIVIELFQRATAVAFKPIDDQDAGLSGDRVLRAHTTVKRYHENSGLLKVGPKYRIAIEREKMEAYVFNKLHPGFHPQILGYSYTRNFAGMRLSWASVDDEEPYAVRRVFGEDRFSVEELTAVIERILGVVLKGWYVRNTGRKTVRLFQHLGRHARKLAECECMAGISGRETIALETIDREIPNPIRLIERLIEIRGGERLEIPYGLHHGDLNSRNILLDAHGHICVIDFYKAGRGLVYLDAARLEADFRYEATSIEPAYLQEVRWIDENLVRLPTSEITRLDVRRSMEKRVRAAHALRSVMQKLYGSDDAAFRTIYQTALLISLIRLLGYGHLRKEMAELAMAELADIASVLDD